MPAAPRIISGFSADSTASDVVAAIDLSGRRALVTGGGSGIGRETARVLAKAGAEVTITARDVASGQEAAADIIAATGNNQVFVAPLDLRGSSSIRALVNSWTGPLHILVNNAGIVLTEKRLTTDGWEEMFATNYLGHFALTTGLHSALAAGGNARVVTLSSDAHLSSPVVFDDINYENRQYDWSTAYGQSKTAAILFAVEASRRWAQDGITVNAVHPGAVGATGLARHMSEDVLSGLMASAEFVPKTLEQGAATPVFVSTSPLLEGVGGLYFEDLSQAEEAQPGGATGVADYALDRVAAQQLWQISERALS